MDANDRAVGRAGESGSDRDAGPPGGIVVGVDGSAGSLTAVQWAAKEAERTNVPLLVVHVVSDQPDYPPYLAAARTRAAGPVVDRALEFVAATVPNAKVTGLVESGSPASELLRLAADSALLVVGSRGHGGFPRLLLGSTSSDVVHRSRVPAVVVPSKWAESMVATPARIVLGVDDGGDSDAAVDYAFTRAAETGAELHLVHALDVPASYGWQAYAGPDDIRRWEESMVRLVRDLVAPWKRKYPDVVVRTRIVHGHPVAVLAHEAAGAQLLVVGGRSRSSVNELLIGSVARGVTHHTPCPTVVVRTGRANR